MMSALVLVGALGAWPLHRWHRTTRQRRRRAQLAAAAVARRTDPARVARIQALHARPRAERRRLWKESWRLFTRTAARS